MIIDFAMNALSQEYREAMQSFFGKVGMVWFGAKVIWFNPTLNEFVYYYVNLIGTGTCEDAVCVCECLTNILLNHRNGLEHLGHNEVGIQSDGAGALAGMPLLARLCHFYQVIGWKVSRYNILS